MNNLGAFSYLEGDWDEAVTWYRRAVEAAERSGNVVEAANTRGNIAEVLVGQRKYEEAIPLLDEADRIFRASDVLDLMVFVRLHAARVAIGMGDVHHGVDELEAVFSAMLESGETFKTPETAVHLAAALVRVGKFDEALERLHRFEREAPEDARRVRVGVERGRGLASAALGQNAAAFEAFDRGLQLASEDGDLYEEALLREARVGTRRRAGEDPDPDDLVRMDELFRRLGIVSELPV